ncbi:MAG TPA: peptide chain release factor N(5)-glutamine methyltransferase [Gemmatimonadales bacterium]|nr:peptide chain release factor N(5)-glutamine methyltransferase [Gemmatimonadales bacterium]
MPPSRSQEWTIETVLRWATDDFRARGIENPRLDAELLLGRALSATRIQMIVDAKRPLLGDELARFRALVKRRRAREPVAYILGEREFHGRTFLVDRRVLIPRPDTETLVDVALERTRHVSMSMRALDLCTGSGCVAVTIARERPTSFVVAADVSVDAMAVARDNAMRLGAYNVAFRSGDLFGAVEGSCRFDLVTANPPYVPSAEIASLQPEIREYEPRLALAAGEDGLDLVRRIVAEAPAHLADGAVVALEVGAGEAAATVELFDDAGFVDVTVRRDYARIERVVSGVLERR